MTNIWSDIDKDHLTSINGSVTTSTYGYKNIRLNFALYKFHSMPLKNRSREGMPQSTINGFVNMTESLDVD